MNLPPVGKEKGGGRLSAIRSKFLTHFVEKQKKAVAKQQCTDSFLGRKSVNHANTRVTLRGNWQRKPSKSLSSKSKNVLKYLTLSGKEVRQRDGNGNGTSNAINFDINGRKAHL